MDAPAAKTAAVVREIWCDVLGVDDIQPDDDFFSLGGESLSAMTVVSRISDRLDVEVSLEGLYENKTFSEFTANVAKAASGATDSGEVTTPGSDR